MQFHICLECYTGVSSFRVLSKRTWHKWWQGLKIMLSRIKTRSKIPYRVGLKYQLPRHNFTWDYKVLSSREFSISKKEHFEHDMIKSDASFSL